MSKRLTNFALGAVVTGGLAAAFLGAASLALTLVPGAGHLIWMSAGAGGVARSVQGGPGPATPAK